MILNINKDSSEEKLDYNSYIEHRSEIIFLSDREEQSDISFSRFVFALKPSKRSNSIIKEIFSNRKHSKELKRKMKSEYNTNI